METPQVLEMTFYGTPKSRILFLRRIRDRVTKLTGEVMTLDALIIEVAKNIFDHARGCGALRIQAHGTSFVFEIHDNGTEAYDFEFCRANPSDLQNDINCGIGLGMILDLAQSLSIDLKIDTSKGFAYSGTYTKK